MNPRALLLLPPLAAALLATACEALPAPGNTTARVVSLGPLRAHADARTLQVDYTLHDPEGDPVTLQLALCEPGQSCTTHACTPVLTTQARGERDPAALTVRSLAWQPPCRPSQAFTLCLRPDAATALESEPLSLDGLRLDTPPCP